MAENQPRMHRRKRSKAKTLSQQQNAKRKKNSASRPRMEAVGRVEAITAITNSHAELFVARKLTFSEPETEGT